MMPSLRLVAEAQWMVLKQYALTTNNDIPLWDFEWEKEPAKISNDEPFPKLITIPTTAGTGAETEGTAMVTDTDKGMKFCICHPGLKPSIAILDPELTLGLPRTLTAWTGADAMIHAIEGYCVPGFHPYAMEPLCKACRLFQII